MNLSTLFIPASGKVVDMFAPKAADIVPDDIAEHLAKEVRYNGGTPGLFYSVAQHSVLGCDWIVASAEPVPKLRARWLEVLAEDDRRKADAERLYFEDAPWIAGASEETLLRAAYYLAHDFHEYVLKDETTPKKRALDRVVVETMHLDPGIVSEADVRLTERWDRAIHEAVGLAWPPPPEIRQLVDALDKRMLLTEWAALHKGHRLIGDYSAYEPLPIAIHPWSWPFAQEMLADRMQRLLPNCRVKG